MHIFWFSLLVHRWYVVCWVSPAIVGTVERSLLFQSRENRTMASIHVELVTKLALSFNFSLKTTGWRQTTLLLSHHSNVIQLTKVWIGTPEQHVKRRANLAQVLLWAEIAFSVSMKSFSHGSYFGASWKSTPSRITLSLKLYNQASSS